MRTIPDGRPVFDLQDRLRELAKHDTTLPRIIPDGVYGAETTAAVIAFQKKYGLNPSGQADKETWERIFEVSDALAELYSPPVPLAAFPCRVCDFGPGDQGDVVYFIQIALVSVARHFADFTRPQVTGMYDGPTEREVKRFQIRNLLEPTGRTDKRTWNRLASSYRIYRQNSIF